MRAPANVVLANQTVLANPPRINLASLSLAHLLKAPHVSVRTNTLCSRMTDGTTNRATSAPGNHLRRRMNAHVFDALETIFADGEGSTAALMLASGWYADLQVLETDAKRATRADMRIMGADQSARTDVTFDS